MDALWMHDLGRYARVIESLAESHRRIEEVGETYSCVEYPNLSLARRAVEDAIRLMGEIAPNRPRGAT